MSKAEKFLGKTYRRTEVSAIVSLIQMTSGKLGVFKRDFKREEQFWAVLKLITGLEPFEDETFMTAVYRIKGTFLGKKASEKEKILKKITPSLLEVAMASYDFSPAKREISSPKEIPSGKTTFAPKKQKISDPKRKSASPSKAEKELFYDSWEWTKLRTKTIAKYGKICMCCGAMPGDVTVGGQRVRIVVDHIKPLHHHWDMRLDANNLQVLCHECNKGKGAWDETDHRPNDGFDEFRIDESIPQEIIDQLKIRH